MDIIGKKAIFTFKPSMNTTPPSQGGFNDHDGQTVTIVGKARGVADLYQIQAEDGWKANAFRDELVLVEEEEKPDELQDIDSEKLDNAVHDAASQMASTINNEGSKEQLEFLRSRGWSDQDILDALK